MGVMDLRRRIMLNEPHIVTTTPAGIASFSTDMIAPLKSCKVEFSPVQSGSGDPSPDNVRPISGWTGANISHRGKNLFDVASYPFSESGYYVSGSNGIYASTVSAVKCTYAFIPCEFLQGHTITLNKRPGGYAPGIAFYSSDTERSFVSGYINSGVTAGTPWTVQVPLTARFMRFTVPASENDIQIELGSTATPYEPYTGSTIPIDWTTEAGTVYGGSLDVITGLLTVTHKYYENAGTGRWGEVTTGGARYYIGGVSSDAKDDSSNGWCNIGVLGSSFYVDAVVVSSNGRINLCGSIHDAFADINELVTYLQSHPLQVAYELATPITYQLAPAQLKTLRGTNNIWSDANGDTTVKYWTH